MGQVVWFHGQKANRVQNVRDFIGAVSLHYRRVVFGPQHGMSPSLARR